MEPETSFVVIGLAFAVGSIVASGLTTFLGGKARDERLRVLEQEADMMVKQVSRRPNQ